MAEDITEHQPSQHQEVEKVKGLTTDTSMMSPPNNNVNHLHLLQTSSSPPSQSTSSTSSTSSSMSTSSTCSVEPDVMEGVYLPAYATDKANCGKFDQAIHLYTQWIKSQCEPDDYRVFFNRAFCFYELDMFDEALSDIDKVIRLKPDWTKGHYVKGKILVQLKQWAMAQESFMTSFKLEEKDRQDDTIRWIRKNIFFYLVEKGYTDFEADYAASKTLTLQEAQDFLELGAFNTCLLYMRLDKLQKLRLISRMTGRIFPKSYY